MYLFPVYTAAITFALFQTLISAAAVPRAFPGLNTTILRLVCDNAVNISIQRLARSPRRSPRLSDHGFLYSPRARGMQSMC
ncbi:hypothetical protein B0F90DRAFT_1726975 [Multifurca ochricompacta]|uniref:Uncharacterized protein n=1 Tax=Multifurca ochricompacta TaxID=376703 RepID=A0AAD4M500_9AGAM|nr:hypothetical protein B0F90DRAFT_1726975 [Multifurca ochricompacta]